MKKLFFSLILFTFLISGIFATDASTIGDWSGKVTIDGVENNGATIDAYINGIKVSSATVGEFASTYYLIHIEGVTGNNVLFRVNGIDATTVPWTNEDNRLNLAVTSPTNGGGSSGGSGGGGSTQTILKSSVNCSENWQCEDWGNCTNDEQTRTCIDLSNCNTVINRPAISQPCTNNSTENNGTTFSSFLTGSAVNGALDFAKSKTGIATILGVVLIAGLSIFLKVRKRKIVA
jgi:hypothetical protein